MILNREKGGYLNGAVVRLCGSFRINGTSDPDVIRDGNSNCIESVTRGTAGVFTVKFLGATDRSQEFPIPERPVAVFVDLHQAVVPTQVAKAHYVVDSYSQANRSFQVKVLDLEVPSAVDPDDNDMISFEIVGAIDQSGTDAA